VAAQVASGQSRSCGSSQLQNLMKVASHVAMLDRACIVVATGWAYGRCPLTLEAAVSPKESPDVYADNAVF